jgi:hypothetical protein
MIYQATCYSPHQKEPTAPAVISLESEESDMARHLTRARLARGVTGAISTLIACAVAAFIVAHHFVASLK